MATLDIETARRIVDGIAILLMSTALASVLTRRLDRSIYLLALQGLLLAAATTVVALKTGTGHAYFAVALTVAVKVLLVPGILLYALHEIRIKREIEVVLSRRLTFPLAVGLIMLAYYVAGPYASLDGFLARNALPAAMSTLLIGLLTMLTRKKALCQVAGIVAMENGLYLMAVVATQGLPLAVELGVAVDVVVGVLVMGVFARQIHRTFDSTNTDRLQSLRG
ncbi:MAG: hypothetical protein Q7O66_09090 [Dehalococcoidia bacterium]|nr:hypothetical protein [Dehalococcoidia bacterium]